jgi:hypothetical protein
MDSFVPKEEEFNKYPTIQREGFADHLTKYLNSKSDQGYVLNLNSEWGSGKTTFLKCWYNKLRLQHPVIYFDAWKNDFTHDAMTALLDCFHAQLANEVTSDKKLVKDLFVKGGRFIKKGVPSLVVGYLKHKTGTEDESLISEITDDLGVELTDDEAGDVIKTVFAEVLEQRNKVNGIEEFKQVLSGLAREYIDAKLDKINYPVYVFIDELDRCRPTYAIEVIECVKHFFNIPNFIFVIATDSQQLQHSIKAVYGSGFDSHLYLDRFFDQSVKLSVPKLDKFLKVKLDKLQDTYIVNDKTLPIVEDIFHYHGITSLREINKILSVLDIAKINDKPFRLVPLLTMNLLRLHFPKTYLKITKNNFNPYRSRSMGSNVDSEVSNFSTNHRAIKHNDGSISYEHFLHTSISGVIMNNDYENNDLAQFKNMSRDQFTNNIGRLDQLIHTYNNSMTRKNGIVKLQDYVSIIEMAGHFEM